MIEIIVSGRGLDLSRDIEGWQIVDAKQMKAELMVSGLFPADAIMLAPTTLFRFDCTEPGSDALDPCKILEKWKYTLFPMDAVIFPPVKMVALYLDAKALKEIRQCSKHGQRKIWTAKDYFVHRQGWDMALAYADAYNAQNVVIHPEPQ